MNWIEILLQGVINGIVFWTLLRLFGLGITKK